MVTKVPRGDKISQSSEQRISVLERRAEAAERPTFAGRQNRDFLQRRLLVLADIAGIVAALAVGVGVFGTGDTVISVFWGLIMLPAWVLIFKMYGLYDRDAKRVSHSTVDDLPWLFHALVLGSLGLWMLYRYGPAARISFLEGVVFFGSALGAIFLARAASRALSRLVIPPERVLFVGGGSMAELLARKFRQHPEYELEPIGYIDVLENPVEGTGGLGYLGSTAEIDTVCQGERVDRVVFLSPEVSHDELAELIRRLRGLDVRISILPHIVDVLGPSVEIDDVEGITILGLGAPALTRSSRLLKRGMDLAVALPLLVLASPVMALTALAVKLTSRGPVLYGQERIGREGRRFHMYKFRTMVVDADSKASELRERSAHPIWLLLDHDPRVTRVGKLLRHASLDELPQLWNVVRGDMSLVGPRPMPPHVDEHISGWGRRRLDLTPGITGLWQVLGRTNIPFEEMVKLDYLYVTNWSLWQDIRLLIHTLPAVLARRGVN